MKMLEALIEHVLDDLGPGIYTIRILTDAVNGKMRYPRWSSHHIADKLKQNPRVQYSGRQHGHAKGSSLWEVVA